MLHPVLFVGSQLLELAGQCWREVAPHIVHEVGLLAEERGCCILDDQNDEEIASFKKEDLGEEGFALGESHRDDLVHIGEGGSCEPWHDDDVQEEIPEGLHQQAALVDRVSVVALHVGW